MKKILLFSALAFWMSVSNAQYFTNFYGDLVPNEYVEGFNTSTLTNPLKGFLVANSGTLAGIPKVEVISTYMDGSEIFRMKYGLADPLVPSTPLNVGKLRVFELPLAASSTRGYGVIGSYLSGLGVRQFFYYQIDAAGSVIYSLGVPIGGLYSSGTSNPGEVEAVTISSAGTEVFVISSSNTNGMCILKIDIATGTLIWSKHYNVTGVSLMMPTTAMVNPYIASEIVVGGSLNVAGSAPNDLDGFALKFDQGTGTIISFLGRPASSLVGLASQVYPNNVDYGLIHSVKKLSNPGIVGLGGKDGFIFGGSWKSAAANPMGMWVLAADRDFTAIRPVQIRYSLATSDQMWGWDIIERLNTTSAYEYYITGESHTGVGLLNNMTIKLDANLGLVANPGFMSTLNTMQSFKVGQDNSGLMNPNTGLSIFGITGAGAPTSQIAITKLCFDGTAAPGCAYTNVIPATVPMTPFVTYDVTLKLDDGNYAKRNISVTPDVMNPRIVFCYTASVPGSNAKILNENKETYTVLVPNPIRLTDILNIQVKDAYTQDGKNPQIAVAIFDLAGRSYYEANTVLSVDHKIQINLAELNLKEGVYMLKISGQGINEHQVLRVVN